MNQPKDYADRSGLLRTDTGDHQKAWDWVEKLAIYVFTDVAAWKADTQAKRKSSVRKALKDG